MVQRYNPDYVMHAARFAPFARENEHGEFVKFSDYEVLKAERDALADRVERLSGMLTESRVATKSAEERADALAVENAALKDVLENICCRDNEPEYHDCGMGCGLEDRGIIDRYAAMAHGWESAMERVYEEVIPFIEDLPETPATDAALAAIQARILPPNIAEIIDSGDLEAICFHSSFADRERIRMALYKFRKMREAK